MLPELFLLIPFSVLAFALYVGLTRGDEISKSCSINRTCELLSFNKRMERLTTKERIRKQTPGRFTDEW